MSTIEKHERLNVIKRNNINIFGEGEKTIIFAHGYGCNQDMWRLVAPSFYREYKVVLFDHVGAGKSTISAYDYARYNSLNGYAEDILEICRELQLNKPIFVGHSVSAMIGVIAAIADPSCFSKLVLVGPSPCYINKNDYHGGFTANEIEELLNSLEENYQDWSYTISQIAIGNGDENEGFKSELAQSFCRSNPEITKHFAQVLFKADNRNELKLLNIDTLILQCSDDIIAPKEVGAYMNQQIANSTLVNMVATGHCPNLTAPKETIRAIKKFIQ